MSDTDQKRSRGRPSDYTPELGIAICERIVAGESLRSICSEDGMPAKATVLRWAFSNPEFRDHYARAREMAAETDADDVEHYARQAAGGEIEPQAANVAIQGLKWAAGKRNSKKYGDALQMKHSGAVGVFDPAKHSTEELHALLRILEPAAIADADGLGDPGGAEEA